MRLALVSDAWSPQVNGVVNSLGHLVAGLRAGGDAVTVIAPDRYRTLPCPTYPEIRLALAGPAQVGRAIEAAEADFIHIATEGPLGFLARRHALKTGRGFTTSYHTKFPEYLAARMPIPLSVSYAFMRRFHNAGLSCLVATLSLKDDLERHGFRDLRLWPRGVDAELFRPRPGADLGLKRPVFLSVGRVAVEKNLDAFLSLDLPGTKLVVGDGPTRASLEQRYPDAVFLGLKRGEALAEIYASADVFVFPSRTDTFGNVMLEAMASGLPVAAFPVTGPSDVIGCSSAGVLDADLRHAALTALAIPRRLPREHALPFGWDRSVRLFRGHLMEANGAKLREAA